jgi:hypothetical protein
MPTATGFAYLAATPIAVTCDASPHSVRNSVPKEIIAARRNGVASRSGLPAASASSLSAPRLSFSSRKAPSPNRTAMAPATIRSGSRVIALPSATAITAWSANARPAPSRTALLRKRLESTSVSAVVLSGSSSRKTAPYAETKARSQWPMWTDTLRVGPGRRHRTPAGRVATRPEVSFARSRG